MSAAFSVSDSLLHICVNSSSCHNVLILLSLSVVTNLSLLVGVCAVCMLAYKCLQMKWWAAVTVVAIPSQKALLMSHTSLLANFQGRESSKRNYSIISPRVIIKAIIIMRFAYSLHMCQQNLVSFPCWYIEFFELVIEVIFHYCTTPPCHKIDRFKRPFRGSRSERLDNASV